MLKLSRCVHQLAPSSRAAAASTSSASPSSTARVDAAAHVPAPLSQNLQDLSDILRDERVVKHTAVLDGNMNSLKQLTHFLKKYSEGMKKDKPLKAQRHALQFVLPGDGRGTELRRVVCNIGSTGMLGGHSLVHRTMQGLFKEAGLSPNFVWDESYEIPEAHLPADQRRAMEEARQDNVVQRIKRVQRGEKAAETDTLKMGTPADASSPLASSQTVPGKANAVPHPMIPPPAAAAHGDSLGPNAQQDLEQLGKELDETIRALALSPWMRVVSKEVAHQESKTVAGLAPLFTRLVPPFMLAVERVWQGQRDEGALVSLLCGKLPKGDHEIATVLVRQLLECTLKLEREVGVPDAEAPVSRRKLAKTIRPVALMAAYTAEHKI